MVCRSSALQSRTVRRLRRSLQRRYRRKRHPDCKTVSLSAHYHLSASVHSRLQMAQLSKLLHLTWGINSYLCCLYSECTKSILQPSALSCDDAGFHNVLLCARREHARHHNTRPRSANILRRQSGVRSLVYDSLVWSGHHIGVRLCASDKSSASHYSVHKLLANRFAYCQPSAVKPAEWHARRRAHPGQKEDWQQRDGQRSAKL